MEMTVAARAAVATAAVVAALPRGVPVVLQEAPGGDDEMSADRGGGEEEPHREAQSLGDREDDVDGVHLAHARAAREPAMIGKLYGPGGEMTTSLQLSPSAEMVTREVPLRVAAASACSASAAVSQ